MKNAYSNYQRIKLGLLGKTYCRADLSHHLKMIDTATCNIIKHGYTLNNELTIRKYKSNVEFIARQLNQQMLESAGV
jgi:hypothetical protein